MDNPIGHGWQAAPEDVYGPPPTPQLSRLLSGGYVSAYYLWLLLWPVNLSPDYSHASIPLLEGLVSFRHHHPVENIRQILPKYPSNIAKVSVKYCQNMPKYAPPPRLRLCAVAPEQICMRC